MARQTGQLLAMGSKFRDVEALEEPDVNVEELGALNQMLGFTALAGLGLLSGCPHQEGIEISKKERGSVRRKMKKSLAAIAAR